MRRHKGETSNTTRNNNEKGGRNQKKNNNKKGKNENYYNKGRGTSPTTPTTVTPPSQNSVPWTGNYSPWQWQPNPWGFSPCPYPSQPRMIRPHLSPSQGILGPRPPQAHYSDGSAPSQTDIEAAMYTLGLTPPEPWVMDTGATSHMTANQGNISSFINKSFSHGITVGNGASIPIHGFGHTTLTHPHPPLTLKNVLYAPKLVKNLISVRKFTTDNLVSVEFDPFGFCVKDLRTGNRLMRCESRGDLYPLSHSLSPAQPSTYAAISPTIWHNRLGHPVEDSVADIFIKGLPLILFDDFRDSLNVRLPPDSTAGV